MYFQKNEDNKQVVNRAPHGCSEQGCMEDALTLKGDEGRGLAAISYGEVPINRYIRRFPNGGTRSSKP